MDNGQTPGGNTTTAGAVEQLAHQAMSTDFESLRSGKALVCHKDHRCDQGVGTVWTVVLADGYLIDCGHGRYAEARANTLATIINSGGEDQWKRLDRDALDKWRAA